MVYSMVQSWRFHAEPRTTAATNHRNAFLHRIKNLYCLFIQSDTSYTLLLLLACLHRSFYIWLTKHTGGSPKTLESILQALCLGGQYILASKCSKCQAGHIPANAQMLLLASTSHCSNSHAQHMFLLTQNTSKSISACWSQHDSHQDETFSKHCPIKAGNASYYRLHCTWTPFKQTPSCLQTILKKSLHFEAAALSIYPMYY